MSRSFKEILQEQMGKTTPTPPPQPSVVHFEPLTWFRLKRESSPTQQTQIYKKAQSPWAIAPELRPSRTWTPVQQVALQQLIRLGANLNDGSTDREIKKAFRKLALQLHPDRNFQASTQEQQLKREQFVAARAAYDLLRT